jgi:hypothetical protein
MRAGVALILEMALATTGCTLQAGEETGNDEPVGEAREETSGFSGPFAFHTRQVGRHTFAVPDKGTVAVTASARWDRPGPCRLPTYSISLVEGGLFGATSTRSYPTSGVSSTETWKGLRKGAYHLVFEAANDNPGCQIVGTVTVAVTP